MSDAAVLTLVQWASTLVGVILIAAFTSYVISSHLSTDWPSVVRYRNTLTLMAVLAAAHGVFLGMVIFLIEKSDLPLTIKGFENINVSEYVEPVAVTTVWVLFVMASVHTRISIFIDSNPFTKSPKRGLNPTSIEQHWVSTAAMLTRRSLVAAWWGSTIWIVRSIADAASVWTVPVFWRKIRREDIAYKQSFVRRLSALIQQNPEILQFLKENVNSTAQLHQLSEEGSGSHRIDREVERARSAPESDQVVIWCSIFVEWVGVPSAKDLLSKYSTNGD